MHRSSLIRHRLTGIFLLGCFFFYSPVLALFDRAGEWAGVPIVYVYLFGAWLIVVILAAIVAEDRRH